MQRQGQTLESSDIIVFGGTGDLAQRKILPALYYRFLEGQLPSDSRVFLVGRATTDIKSLHQFVCDTCERFIPPQHLTKDGIALLIGRLEYHTLDAENIDDFFALKEPIVTHPRAIRIFYLATPADIYGKICTHLHMTALCHDKTRIVLEKPIGYGLDSFATINTSVLKHFDESQIYRIDHYLGKETVQNLMVLRFTNNVFHKVWDGTTVDHVQITVAESTGLEGRHTYYDDAGALRDMVQNHLLQLLCLVAMEPPNIANADTIRDEKLKVLRALRPMNTDTIRQHSARGQYAAGYINGRFIPSYLQEVGKEESNTETFVALKCFVDNWRWSGVPFYMRTGKSMPSRYSEVVIHFNEVNHCIFDTQTSDMVNKLVIRIQPDEYIKFQMMTKVPGPGGYRMKPVYLNLSLAEEFDERTPDAYERLLMDVVRGNQTLFMRSDEVEAAWRWVESIISSWKEIDMPVEYYPAGSEGPVSASALIHRDHRIWNRKEKQS